MTCKNVLCATPKTAGAMTGCDYHRVSLVSILESHVREDSESDNATGSSRMLVLERPIGPRVEEFGSLRHPPRSVCSQGRLSSVNVTLVVCGVFSAWEEQDERAVCLRKHSFGVYT